MIAIQRQKMIAELIRSEPDITNTELEKRLFVSSATIRRDLIELEKAGQIHRIHGGAIPVNGLSYEIPFSYREKNNKIAKQNIAAKAAEFVSNGDTVILDASSTVANIVPFLSAKSDLTVITNSPKTALSLADSHIRTLVTGGLLLENSIAFVGRSAEAFLEGFSADVLFISCRGVSEDGYLTDSSLEEADIRRTMLHCLSRKGKKIALCDKSKLDRTYTHRICHMDELDSFITEKGIRLCKENIQPMTICEKSP